MLLQQPLEDICVQLLAEIEQEIFKTDVRHCRNCGASGLHVRPKNAGDTAIKSLSKVRSIKFMNKAQGFALVEAKTSISPKVPPQLRLCSSAYKNLYVIFS